MGRWRKSAPTDSSVDGFRPTADRHCTRTQGLLTETEFAVQACTSPRKLADGGGLYLLLAPNGGRYRRYNYRFDGKNRTLAFGVYPDVSLEKARARHQAARRQLTEGIDRSIDKGGLQRGSQRTNSWNAFPNRLSAAPCCPTSGSSERSCELGTTIAGEEQACPRQRSKTTFRGERRAGLVAGRRQCPFTIYRSVA